jgi:hypothetical protein
MQTEEAVVLPPSSDDSSASTMVVIPAFAASFSRSLLPGNSSNNDPAAAGMILEERRYPSRRGVDAPEVCWAVAMCVTVSSILVLIVFILGLFLNFLPSQISFSRIKNETY